ncbi:MAG: hypothetical protein HOF35_03565 [Bacteroidetes bacterium]|nr:hypothetical protein [Bacteroidota bacterium]MBT6047860.1 hypothetical protein [Candidatus Scalindua sp.]
MNELDDENITSSDFEAIEAEVAYFCRDISGHWPMYQQEIHFHQSNEMHRKLAKKIYEWAVR